jgi:hypothetical protein
MKKRFTFIILSVVGLLIVAAVALIPRNVFLSTLVEQMAPGVIPASSYARNLNSTNPNLVRESLAHLMTRKDPIAVKRAIELLQSPDDYIWLNAAEYLGVCGQREAVPYLIKALRHTAWRADQETAQSLRTLTAQDFGTDFTRWRDWWLSQHSESTMDWTSHLGFSPRLAKAADSLGGGQQRGPTNRSAPVAH